MRSNRPPAPHWQGSRTATRSGPCASPGSPSGTTSRRPASWRLDASVRPIPPNTLSRRAGSRAVTVPERFRRDSPGFKSTSYFGAVAALRHARRSGGDEGLFTDGDLYVEGASTGLVAWNGGRLAGLGPGGLPSVTAEAFLDGAGERRGLDREELLAGAILLGSLTTAVPLLSLDGVECSRPPAMLRACEAFRAAAPDGCRVAEKALDCPRREARYGHEEGASDPRCVPRRSLHRFPRLHRSPPHSEAAGAEARQRLPLPRAGEVPRPGTTAPWSSSPGRTPERRGESSSSRETSPPPASGSGRRKPASCTGS